MDHSGSLKVAVRRDLGGVVSTTWAVGLFFMIGVQSWQRGDASYWIMVAVVPVLMLAVAFNEGWPPAVANFLVRIEEWTGELLLYVFMATDKAPRFGFAADPSAEHRAVVIGTGTAVGITRSAQPTSAEVMVTKSISGSTAPTNAGSRSA